jgi:hypothetical protein
MPASLGLFLDQPVPKNCWICGASFICGPQGKEKKCWCAALPAISPSEASECLCPACLRGISEGETKFVPAGMDEVNARPSLTEGEDYYREGSAIVFTATYLLRRGFCCGNGCRHCPFEGAVAERTLG